MEMANLSSHFHKLLVKALDIHLIKKWLDGRLTIYGNGWSKHFMSTYGNGELEVLAIYGNGND
jgi:hypothetical protein